MPLSDQAKEHQKQYRIEYGKKRLKRVPLDLKQDYYDQVKAFLTEKGVPVNTYIKTALSEKLEQDGFQYVPRKEMQ